MTLGEIAHLKSLPEESFGVLRQEARTLNEDGIVQVDCLSYAATSALLNSGVAVHVHEREIEILEDQGQLVRRHPGNAEN
jgi:hypothetical protein